MFIYVPQVNKKTGIPSIVQIEVEETKKTYKASAYTPILGYRKIINKEDAGVFVSPELAKEAALKDLKEGKRILQEKLAKIEKELEAWSIREVEIVNAK